MLLPSHSVQDGIVDIFVSTSVLDLLMTDEDDVAEVLRLAAGGSSALVGSSASQVSHPR